MNSRQAFQVFIRFQLNAMIEGGYINLSEVQIEKFANGVEDDPNFYDALSECIADYIDDYGENYEL